jgi:hypothetical protein
MLVVHYSAILWYYQSQLASDSSQTYLGASSAEQGNSLYLESVYYIMTTFSTVGYGDIVAVSIEQRLITTFFIFFGVAMFSFFIGNFTQTAKLVS